MMLACVLGYVAIGVSFYLYITRTAEIEPEVAIETQANTPTLTMINAASDTNATRKAA